MGEAGDRHDVGSLSRKACVGVRGIRVVQLGFLARLHAEKRRVIRVFAVDHGSEPEVRQFLLATVGNRHLGGALHRHVAFIGIEVVDGKAFDQPSAFDASHGHAHTVFREGVGHPRR